MRAVYLGPEGLRYVPDHPEPRPVAGEAVVRVLLAGICETDLQPVRGYMQFRGIPGHEFVGIAESGPFRGRRVVGEINCSCGTCDYCLRDLPNHCPARSVLGILNHDGAFADRICVPQANLHPVPNEISNLEAVFTEPLAAAFQVPAQVSLWSKQKVVVLGDGRLGNLCAQVLLQQGCDVTVVGKHDRRLALLLRLGIATVLLNDRETKHFADLVVDCTGSSTGLSTALEIVKPRGTIVLKTAIAGTHSVALAPVVIDEVTIVGSRCGPFPAALLALRQRQIDVASLIDGIYPLDEAETAFGRAQNESVLKLILAVDESQVVGE
jgi:threonine dehydrogenase-like Zn-dependent dehydrogenase